MERSAFVYSKDETLCGDVAVLGWANVDSDAQSGGVAKSKPPCDDAAFAQFDFLLTDSPERHRCFDVVHKEQCFERVQLELGALKHFEFPVKFITADSIHVMQRRANDASCPER